MPFTFIQYPLTTASRQTSYEVNLNMYQELGRLLSKGEIDADILAFALEKLPYDLSELPTDIQSQLAELVPQIAELLCVHHGLDELSEQHVEKASQLDSLVESEQQYRFWILQSEICRLLAYLGHRARAALPALLAHIDRYPRFELNAWAVGKIGGPGVVRSLIDWTYWGIYFGRHKFDRKCYDSICGAISSLGESAIEELLEIASPTNENIYERNTAILNLVQNTDYPPLQSIPLITTELDRIAGTLVHPMCREFLRDCLVSMACEHAKEIVAAIEPFLLANSAAFDDYFLVLSELGTAAIPTLKKALENSMYAYPAISAFARIEGEGLDHIYEFIATSKNRIAVVHAIKSTPVCGSRAFINLATAIEKWRRDWKYWGMIRRFVVRRLREFSDQQEEIVAYLKSLRDDPDSSLSSLAKATLSQLTEIRIDRVDDAL